MSACVMGTQPSAARNRNYYFPRGTLTANNDTSLHVSFTGCTELKDKSSTAANAFRVSCFPRWGFMFSLLNTVCNATRLRWVDCFWLLEPLCPNRCFLYSGFMFSPCGVSCFPYMQSNPHLGLTDCFRPPYCGPTRATSSHVIRYHAHDRSPTLNSTR